MPPSSFMATRGIEELDQRNHLAVLDFEELSDFGDGLFFGVRLAHGGAPADGGLVAGDEQIENFKIANRELGDHRLEPGHDVGLARHQRRQRPPGGRPRDPKGGVVGVAAPKRVHVARDPGGAQPSDQSFDLAAITHDPLLYGRAYLTTPHGDSSAT